MVAVHKLQGLALRTSLELSDSTEAASSHWRGTRARAEWPHRSSWKFFVWLLMRVDFLQVDPGPGQIQSGPVQVQSGPVHTKWTVTDGRDLTMPLPVRESFWVMTLSRETLQSRKYKCAKKIQSLEDFFGHNHCVMKQTAKTSHNLVI